MSADSTYYAYLSEEITVQRNGAMEELANARTQVRLANLEISSLESEMYYLKKDLADYANELDYLYEYIEAITSYVDSLEKNSDAALVESQKRLRQRIEVLEKKLQRLCTKEVPEDVPEDREVFLTEAPAIAVAETNYTPPIAAIGAPGQNYDVTNSVYGGRWIPVEEDTTPPASSGIGAPGQGSAVLGKVGSGVGTVVPEKALEAMEKEVAAFEKNTQSLIPGFSDPIILENGGETHAEAMIRKFIEQEKRKAALESK